MDWELTNIPLTVEQLEALPNDAVVLDLDNDAWQKYEDEWYAFGEDPLISERLHYLYAPDQVLWGGSVG
ncbi:hypothetical protein ACXIUA_11685, partial [Corynebacterium sp. UMB8791]